MTLYFLRCGRSFSVKSLRLQFCPKRHLVKIHGICDFGSKFIEGILLVLIK